MLTNTKIRNRTMTFRHHEQPSITHVEWLS